MNRLLRLLANKKTYQSLFLIICILFVQIGYSVFFSFGSLGFFILFLCVKKQMNRYITNVITVFFCGCIFLLILYSIRYGDSFLFAFRDMRISVIICCFILLINPKNRLKLQLNFNNIVFICTSTVFLFVLAQKILSAYNIYYVMPDEYYAIDDGVLASKWLKRSIEFGYDFSFRPSASYSEPSYLGFICCCLYYFEIHQPNTILTRITKIMLVTTVFVSASALGIGGILILMLVDNWRKYILPNLPFIILLIAICTVLFSLELNDSRLALILKGSDESALTRFVKPFEIIFYNFTNGDILGIPYSCCIKHYLKLRFYSTYDDPPFHNTLINLIINYGIIGFFLIYSFFFTLMRNIQEKFLFLIGLSQNGDFFIFGKVSIFLLFILVVRQQKYWTLKYK